MKRRTIAIVLIGLLAVTSPIMAGKNCPFKKGKKGKSSASRSKAPTFKESEIRFKGVLSVEGSKLSVSGVNAPLTMDRGLSMMAKKHNGNEVEIIGKRVTVNGKSKIRVRFVRAL